MAFITALLVAATAGPALAQQPAAKRPSAKPAAPAPAPGAAGPAPVAAAPPATPGEGDERCLLAMALLTRDQKNAQAASLAMIYYAGRLSARGVDVPTAVEHAKAKLVPQNIPGEIQRCGPAFQAGMGSLQKTFAAAPPPPATGAAAPAPSAAAAPPITQTPK
jgi:hypothetical protein